MQGVQLHCERAHSNPCPCPCQAALAKHMARSMLQLLGSNVGLTQPSAQSLYRRVTFVDDSWRTPLQPQAPVPPLPPLPPVLLPPALAKAVIDTMAADQMVLFSPLCAEWLGHWEGGAFWCSERRQASVSPSA